MSDLALWSNRVGSILRYHKFSQLRLRIASRIRRKIFEILWANRYPAIVPPLPLRECGSRRELIDRHLVSSHDVCAWWQGEFCFLDETRRLGNPPDWTLRHQDASHLWRFHLHYHDFLLPDCNRGMLDANTWTLVLNWIDNYPVGAFRATTDGWHPFCISKRLVNWIVLWSISPPEQRSADVLGSIVSQADFLKSHLETDLGGNHLIENARALAVVAAFFDQSDRWAASAIQVLESQLDQQFLPHGEHFERSPMYHKHMLVALWDIRDAIRGFSPQLAEKCDCIATKATEFLAMVLHQDGEIPLFGDSVLDDGPPACSLVAETPDVRCVGSVFETHSKAKRSDLAAARDVGGYWVFDDGRSRILFDRSPAGPDHLMGHAHADLLNIVCSIDGQRWIVDSGVFDYADSEMRQYCRGSSAHNVLQVDGEDQFDLWSGFRVGQRGWPSTLTSGALQGEHLTHFASAEHDAYRHLGVHVGRWVSCGNLSICCVDWIHGRTAEHELVTRIHLHPDIQVELSNESAKLVSPNSRTPPLTLRALKGVLSVRDGWYCPNFGQRRRNSVLEVSRRTSKPGVIGWHISADQGVRLSEAQDSWRLDSDGKQVFRHVY